MLLLKKQRIRSSSIIVPFNYSISYPPPIINSYTCHIHRSSRKIYNLERIFSKSIESRTKDPFLNLYEHTYKLVKN